MNFKTLLIVIAAAVALVLGGSLLTQSDRGPEGPDGKKDDWVYEPDTADYDSSSGFNANQPTTTMSAPPSARVQNMSMAMESEDALGFSVGGAKDINGFRENIEHGFLPLPTDLTFEGLIYDYYFDTGMTEICNSLFCPSYQIAVANDPLSGEAEYYLTVGLNSGLKESDFERKKLNVVVVLDISGSMSSPFDSYYYDQVDGNEPDVDEDAGKTKLEIAARAIVNMLAHLNEDDRLGVVLFDNNGYLGKPLNLVGNTDMDAVREHILSLEPAGGTNMAAGMRLGTSLFSEFTDVDTNEYENRIIFLTDAMPNLGETHEDGLLGMTDSNAKDRIYTTFIGIGLDFNTQLIEHITKIRGANYYSVHSASEFKERMDEGFEFMVTPLVFGLELSLEADGFEIEKVYGSPEADQATGQLMYISTLFPSKTEGGETKGGVVLLKLKPTGDVTESSKISLNVNYENRQGDVETVSSDITFGVQEGEFYQNSGIRKAVMLARYVDFLQNWLIDERVLAQADVRQPHVNMDDGIVVPDPRIELGKWERQSTPLNVMVEYKVLMQTFNAYFESEMHELSDETLNQEMNLLQKLSTYEQE